MALYSIQGETLGEIADAIREQTGTAEPIQTNEMSSMIRKIEGGSPNAVLYTEQSLTDEQKAQARENIGAAAIGESGGSSEDAVVYTEQELTSEQKNQARKNIDSHVGEQPVDADEGAVWIDPDSVGLILGNAIMAEDINEGDVEIFGSFISEDSVIAKDENSDGNINLQTFVKGEGPSVEYATKEELAALTAEDVGARPDSWMPTIADIGAAPAGYGLGEELPTFQVNDLNSATRTGTYRYGVGSANAPTNSGEWVRVESYSSTFKHQTAFVSYTGGHVAERWMRNGVWEPWEWRNPPLSFGVEYRTTERYNGKPVYIKCVNYGYITTGTTTIEHGISSIDDVVGLDIINRTYGFFSNSAEVHGAADRTNVSVTSAWSMGGFVYIIKYTKL